MPRRKPPRRRAYDTDLTDGQWKLIAPLISEANPWRSAAKALRAGAMEGLFAHFDAELKARGYFALGGQC